MYQIYSCNNISVYCNPSTHISKVSNYEKGFLIKCTRLKHVILMGIMLSTVSVAL